MNIRRILTFAVLVLATTAGAVQSTTTAPVYTVQCIPDDGTGVCADYLTSTNFSNTDLAHTVVMAQGYHRPGDGGGGWFYNIPAGCTQDWGTIFRDSANNCFKRRFTGTVYLAWFGATTVTATSPTFDVAKGCPASAMDHNNCWTKAFMAASALGNNVVSTGGMYLYSSLDVTPQSGQTLTCDAPFTQEEDGSDYSSVNTVPGAIVLAHGASIRLKNRTNEFHHCVVLTIGDSAGGHAINLAPDSQRKALDNDKNMVANGDTGVFCDGPDGTYIHDVTVIGFDTGIASLGCSHFRVENVNIDAPVGIYLQSNKSPAYVNHVRVYSMLAAGVSNALTTYPVSAIFLGSLGQCEITAGSTNVSDGDWVSLAGDGVPAHEGPISCYGTFRAQKDGANVILVGTKYSTTTFASAVPAAWVSNSNILNVADMTGIQKGECITAPGDSTVFNGYSCGATMGSVRVRSVSYYSRKVVIAEKTQDNSSSSSTLSFSNAGGYGSGSNLLLSAPSKIDAGNSTGGVGAGNIASCFVGGGPGDTSTLGFLGGDFFCFDHRRQYVAASLGPFSCHGCGFDSKAGLFDIQQIGVLFGRGTDPLALTATYTGSSTPANSLVPYGSNFFNPIWAGWSVYDPMNPTNLLVSSTGDIDGKTISAINCPSGGTCTVTLSSSSVTPGMQPEMIYDVKPAILMGNTSLGDTKLTITTGDPSSWNVGDIVVAPRGSFIPSGARVVSTTNTMGSWTITLNVPAIGSTMGTPTRFADTTVSAVNISNVGTRGADFAAAVLGGGGGIIFDSNASGCNAVHAKVDANNPGQAALEVVQGCALVTNVSASQPNDFMIDTGGVPNTTTVMTGASVSGGIFFEGPVASATFAGNGNTFAAGGTANTQTFGDTLTGTLPSGYYPCSTTSAGVLVVFCGGDGLYGTAGGNAYEICNNKWPTTGGLAGCVQTLMDSNGIWKQVNSVNNTIYEFNNGSQAVLPMPYQDQMVGRVQTVATSVAAAISDVSSCARTGCTSGGLAEGVKLPSTAGWVDAGGWPNTPCTPPLGSGHCGVGGPITIINTYGTAITVWPAGSETINGSATGTVGTNNIKTYYPVLGVGWFTPN